MSPMAGKTPPGIDIGIDEVDRMAIAERIRALGHPVSAAMRSIRSCP